MGGIQAFARQDWSVLGDVVTLVSFIFAILMYMSGRRKNDRLNGAFFQMREIYLHITRFRDAIKTRELVPREEIVALLDGYEAMAAAGMHGIRPHSLPIHDVQFPISRSVFAWMKKAKRGIAELRGKRDSGKQVNP